MSYSQFGYSYTTTPQLLMTTSAAGTAAAAAAANGGCCERPTVVADPLTGQPICSCQYDSRAAALSALPRLSTASNAHQSSANVYDGTTTFAAAAAAAAAYASAGLGLEHGTLYSPLGNPYALKEASSDVSAWQGLTQTPSYYAYDPAFAAYTAGYGTYDFNSARRKNATRETTATLKAWLNEHKKNPYPTKGEKIMLAIITKMTLTQVSTWFANARRRLKKENKMTWEPKNKTGDDDEDDDDEDDDEEEDNPKISIKDEPEVGPLRSVNRPSDEDDDEDDHDHSSSALLHQQRGVAIPSPPTTTTTAASTATATAAPTAPKPKIWSLADTATCKTPPPVTGPSVPPPTFPSGQAWVPSLGAFQALSHPHQQQFGASRSPAVASAPPYSTPADTPPHTPPNAKGHDHNPHSHHHHHHHSMVPYRRNTFVPPRVQTLTGNEQSRDLMGGSRNLISSSESLYNMADVSSSATAFKPIFKRENQWS